MPDKLRLLSLFSGIGGYDRGAEMTGRFETVAFCEINPFARAVLAKHWPNVPCFPDVTKLTKDQINGPIEAICAGFPCQDLSYAGKGAGIEGARSGLWSEVVRLVRELRPAIVMLENVPAILTRGLGAVLRDLAEIGYNAIWDCIRASDIGAQHRRDRWFLVAYAERKGLEGPVENNRFLGCATTSLAKPLHDAALQWRVVDKNCSGIRGGDGLSLKLDRSRLAALGNAIVPLWAYLVSKVAIAIFDSSSAATSRQATKKNRLIKQRGPYDRT
jgi:DNA (cytosine-5)-methyltransferase 1